VGSIYIGYRDIDLWGAFVHPMWKLSCCRQKAAEISGLLALGYIAWVQNVLKRADALKNC
jgi:hypothetical protein